MRWLHRPAGPFRWHWADWTDDEPEWDGCCYGYVDQSCRVCGRKRRKWLF